MAIMSTACFVKSFRKTSVIIQKFVANSEEFTREMQYVVYTRISPFPTLVRSLYFLMWATLVRFGE